MLVQIPETTRTNEKLLFKTLPQIHDNSARSSAVTYSPERKDIPFQPTHLVGRLRIETVKRA